MDPIQLNDILQLNSHDETEEAVVLHVPIPALMRRYRHLTVSLVFRTDMAKVCFLSITCMRMVRTNVADLPKICDADLSQCSTLSEAVVWTAIFPSLRNYCLLLRASTGRWL